MRRTVSAVLQRSAAATGILVSRHASSSDGFDDNSGKRDIEASFRGAMAHLRSGVDDKPGGAAAAWHAAKKARAEVQTTDVHGRLLDDPDAVLRGGASGNGKGNDDTSFFDEGGIDVRGKKGSPTADKKKKKKQKKRAKEGKDAVPEIDADAAWRSDVLKLSGARRSPTSSSSGVKELPGGRVVQEDNNAPHDPTLPSSSTKGFGDTPAPITDMLRERIAELKSTKLRDLRTETHLPRVHDAQPAAKDLEALHELAQKRQPTKRVGTAVLDRPGDEEEAKKDGVNDAAAQRERLRNLLMKGRDTPEATSSLSSSNLPDSLADTFDPFAIAADAAGLGDGMATASTTGRRLGRFEQDFDTGAAEDGKVPLLRAVQRAGFASRRNAVAMINSGDVRVNGEEERNPFVRIGPEDDVYCKGHGQRLRFQAPRLWLYNKPVGVKMKKSGPGEEIDFRRHAMMLGLDHLIPANTLPTLAMGAVLLTNDGDLARFLSHPEARIQSTWQLRVKPAVPMTLAAKWNAEGVNINGVVNKEWDFSVMPNAKSKYQLKLKTRTSKMFVGDLMRQVGRHISRGGRISVGPYALKGLGPGTIKEVTVPPYFLRHINPVWEPFIERDWPYFRRKRIGKLKALARVRSLSAKEREELDHFTYSDLQEQLAFDASEVSAEEAAMAAAMREHEGGRPPSLEGIDDERLSLAATDPFAGEGGAVNSRLPVGF